MDYNTAPIAIISNESAQHEQYIVPQDPFDLMMCESCQ